MRFRLSHFVLFLVAFVLLRTPQHLFGQASNNSNIITLWVSEVSTANPDIWRELGKFYSYDDAVRCSKKWSDANPDNLALTREREIMVRVTPPGRPEKAQPAPILPSVAKPGGMPFASPVMLPNTSWTGGETLQGYGALTFRFGDRDTVYMIDRDGSTPGQYSRSGNTVTLRFYDGAVVYSGTVHDNIFYGSGRHNRGSWTFSVRLQ